MDAYIWLKLIHILSAAILFGTGLGTAFFMWRADRSGDVATIAATARIVVLADWLFTAPAVVIQPLTGALLAARVGYGFGEGWLLAAYGLYALVGACWLPVVGLQRRMRDLAAAAHETGTDLPPAYHQAMRWWFRLGWPAFAGVLALYWIMLTRPEF